MSTIKQHYVPQFYLKRFSIDPTVNRPKFFRLKKSESSSLPIDRRIENYCQDNYFYSFPKKVGDYCIEFMKENFKVDVPEEFVEDYYLSKIDTHISNFWNSFFNSIEVAGPRPLTLSERKNFAFAIAFQYLRTKTFREYIMQELQQTDTEKSVDAIFHYFAINNKSLLKKFTDCLSRGTIFFGVNNTEIPLITSDNPVVIDSNLSLIALPISPKYFIVIYHMDLNGDLDPNTSYIEANSTMELYVKHLNKLQYEQCSEYIFSQSNQFLY